MSFPRWISPWVGDEMVVVAVDDDVAFQLLCYEIHEIIFSTITHMLSPCILQTSFPSI